MGKAFGISSARGRIASVTAFAMVASLAAVIGTGVTGNSASAASGDGALTVQVVRDMGANGKWDPLIDLPLAGVAVTVTDHNGNSVALTTDASGVATLPAGNTQLTGGKYRVSVANPDADYYTPAFAANNDPSTTPSATDLSPNQEYVDLSDGDVDMATGFWHARDYCQSNPQVANACQPGIFNHAEQGASGVETSPRDTVFLTNYNNSDYEQIAKSAAEGTNVGTGSVFGIAYNRLTKKVYSAAYAKRNVDYGDAGPGGIYITDPTTKETKVFTTVPNAGTTLHDLTPISGGGEEDLEFRKAVGKESLGTIVMSDDYKTLFVMNMNDKHVYAYDATNDTAAAPIRTIDVSANVCGVGTVDGDWRPTGLGENDGVLYVGGVCTGESEATSTADNRPDSMKVVVMAFDENTGASQGVVLDQPLTNYLRPLAGASYSCTDSTSGYSPWLAWSDDLWCNSASQDASPQPMLLKMLVEANGDLVLNFRDRSADQFGPYLLAKTVGSASSTSEYVITSGWLNLACFDSTSNTYVMDVQGGCGVASPDSNGVGITFYNQQGGPHSTATFAGMTRSRAEEGLISDQMDAGGPVFTNGLTAFRQNTGGQTAWQTIGAANGPTMNGFSKGAGLADMDVLCDLAPIQIGNRVWYNEAADGIERAAEAPVVGATVNLYDSLGNLVATTVTNDRGEYYFDSINDGLDYNTDYVVKMDNPADYEEGGPLDSAKWDLTKLGSGANGNKASAGPDGFPQIALTTGDPGETNHSYDIGFAPKPGIHIVKYDGRLEGPVGGSLAHNNNADNPTVYEAGPDGKTGPQPIAMIVTNSGSAALGNVNVADATLQKPAMTGLTCDFSALGGPSTGTHWGGIFQPGDSFPCTGSINLTAGNKHADEVKVTAEQVDPVNGSKVEGVPPVSDSDRYYAKTGFKSEIVITKRDKKTGTEADTAATAMQFKRGKTRTIDMPTTNVGTSPITNVQVSDKNLKGPKVKNFRCTFPDGSKAKANKKGVVRWKASFGANPKTWNPGVTFHCTANLTMKGGKTLHGDRVTVTGLDPAGARLTAKNPFFAQVSKRLALGPNTGK
jgi:hypothetical protein